MANYITECLKKFKALPRPVQEAVGGFAALEIIQDLEKKYQIKLGFFVILVAIGELMMEDIEGYLQKKYGLSAEAAADINDTLQENVFGPAIEMVAANPELIAPNLTIAEQKKNIFNLFKEKLVETISADSNIINGVNILIFNIIASELADENLMFENDLAKIILENQARLTSKPFRLLGKPAEPTIANWLKDFIAKCGSDYFNSLILSEYLINSENAKNLSAEEKKLLAKTLTLYRNLKFFSATAAEVPMEGWEFISVDEERSKTPVINENNYNLENMTPIEIKALGEANNFTAEDLKKMSR